MDKLYNNKSNILLSTIAPNPSDTKYWADLSEDPSGGIVKFFNGTSWKNINFQDIENVKELQKNKIGREEVASIITGDNGFSVDSDSMSLYLEKIGRASCRERV